MGWYVSLSNQSRSQRCSITIWSLCFFWKTIRNWKLHIRIIKKYLLELSYNFKLIKHFKFSFPKRIWSRCWKHRNCCSKNIDRIILKTSCLNWSRHENIGCKYSKINEYRVWNCLRKSWFNQTNFESRSNSIQTWYLKNCFNEC